MISYYYYYFVDEMDVHLTAETIESEKLLCK